MPRIGSADLFGGSLLGYVVIIASAMFAYVVLYDLVIGVVYPLAQATTSDVSPIDTLNQYWRYGVPLVVFLSTTLWYIVQSMRQEVR